MSPRSCRVAQSKREADRRAPECRNELAARQRDHPCRARGRPGKPGESNPGGGGGRRRALTFVDATAAVSRRRAWHRTRPPAANLALPSQGSGGGGIRTLDGPNRPITVFETAAFNRSATPPDDAPRVASGRRQRRAAKNATSGAAHSSASSPPSTSGRWLRRGSASTSSTLPAAPALGSGGAVDDARDAREHDRARAHRARLERDVERRVEQPPGAQAPRRLAQREHLGVGGRVLAQLALVVAGADHLAVRGRSRPRPGTSSCSSARSASRSARRMKCSSFPIN